MKSKIQEKDLVLKLRKRGFSYNQIRDKVKVSKSTLSLWLRSMPLSKEAVDSLRGKNPQRIERFRNTMKAKREEEELVFFKRVSKELGKFTKRERLIAGLFLYWGEGTKAALCTTAVTNTDPDVLRFFVHWLNMLGIKNDQLTVVLHLYKDMNAKKEIDFWSSYLNISLNRFRKPYIKNSKLCDITYKSGFNHGTCSVLYLKKDLYLYIRSALKYIRMRA